MIKDYILGDKNWHLEIRDLSKCYLVHLVEELKVKSQLTDAEMVKLISRVCNNS